jgi:hypothetical protein
MSQAEARLTVGRWTNTYLVPAEHPSPEDLRNHLDRCLSQLLPELSRALLAPLLDAADGSVWRIRELTLDFSADAGFHAEETIAKTWAELLALQISAILRQGRENDSILHFENRAAYLTQLVLDIAAGRAWEKWYYREFESLRSLSFSQAISETLVREPDQALAVILRLAAAQRLEEVLWAVTETDAGKIYEACFAASAGASTSDEHRWVGHILDLWNEKPLCPTAETPSRHRNALRLLARTAARFPDACASQTVKTALDGLLELQRVLAALQSPVTRDRIIALLADQDSRGAVDLASRAGATNPGPALEFFSRAMAGDAHWGMQAAAVVLSDKFQDIAAAARTVSGGESILTLCGGIFLLGPALLELDVHGIVAAIDPGDEAGRTMSLLRQLLALKCLGRSRSGDAMHDAALRLFSGFQGGDLLGAVQELNATQPDLERTQSILVQNLALEGRCEGRCLLAEMFSLPFLRDEVLLLRDLPQNQWVHLFESSGDAKIEVALEKAVAMVSQATGNEPEIIMLSGRLSKFKDSEALASRADRIVVLDSPEAFSWDALATEFGVRSEQLSRASRPALADLAFLSLANLWPEVEISAAIDLALSLVARAALKYFAQGLIGFESSGPEYLYQNFLSGVSTVRTTVDRIEVQIPSAPLFIILKMSGMQEQHYTLPWLKGKEICLLPPAV